MKNDAPNWQTLQPINILIFGNFDNRIMPGTWMPVYGLSVKEKSLKTKTVLNKLDRAMLWV